MAKKKFAGPVVNKYAAKVTQDGVELTWNAEKIGEVSPQEAADFYVESVEALQKFKKADPRTRPDLQAWEKAIKGSLKFLGGCFVLAWIVWAAIEFGAAHGSTNLSGWRSEGRWGGSGWSHDRGW